MPASAKRRWPAKYAMSERLTQTSCTCAEMTERPSRSSAYSFSISSDFGAMLADDAFDGGAAGAQFLFEAFEPAVEVIDAVDCRLALRSERCDHQRHRSAQVGGHHRGAAQPLD